MILVLLFVNLFLHQGVDMKYVRDAFHIALESEAECKALKQYLTDQPQGDAISDAYHAAIVAMHAQYLDGPYEKWKAVKASQLRFEKAVAKKPSDPEIRYLRCLVELNLPSFLPIDKHVEDDLKVVTNGLVELHAALGNKHFETARTYLLNNAPLSSSQLQTLQRWKP